MAQVEYTIICDDIRMEKGNKVSLMGIYGNQMLVAEFPFRFARLGFVQRWTNLPDGQKFRVVFRGEGFKGLTVEGEIQYKSSGEPKQSNDTNIVLNFNGIVFPKPGRFIFETSILGSEEQTYKYEISVSKAKPGQLD